MFFLLVLSIGLFAHNEEAKAYTNWEPKTYTVNYQATAYGMQQVGSKALAPVGFAWLENGIPMSAVNYKMGLSQATFTFKASKVWITGKPRVYDQGYYYTQFGTPWGTFYAKANSLKELLYISW